MNPIKYLNVSWNDVFGDPLQILLQCTFKECSKKTCDINHRPYKLNTGYFPLLKEFTGNQTQIIMP